MCHPWALPAVDCCLTRVDSPYSGTNQFYLATVSAIISVVNL